MDRDKPLAARRARLSARSSSAMGAKFKSAEEAVTSYYEHPSEPNMKGDEFITPFGDLRRWLDAARRRCATATAVIFLQTTVAIAPPRN